MIPPKAPQHPYSSTVHGDTRDDHYFWLKDVHHPETKPYLEAENAYTEHYFSKFETLSLKLSEEMKARIVKDDSTPPAKSDDYYYYKRTEGDKEQALLCRRKGAVDASEEILLDCNQLAAGHKSFSLGVYSVSPNHQLLAYATDTDGSEIYTLQFKDLKTGELFPQKIERAYYGGAWTADNKTFYYITQDENQRPTKLWRYKLNTPTETAELVFEETDSQYFISCSLSESEDYVVLHRGSHSSTEVHYFDARKENAERLLVSLVEENVEYEITHRGDYFYILTNREAPTFRLCRASIAHPSSANWETILESRADRTLSSVTAFKKFMVVTAIENALTRVYKMDYDTFQLEPIEFPDPIYQVSLGPNLEFDTDWLRLNYNSLVQPNQIYDLNLFTKEKIVRKVQQIPSGYNANDYASERLWAPSIDGTLVPISLVYKKSLRKKSGQPTLLYSYGAYGHSSQAAFNTNRISLLDRGYIYAIAHVRGGGDMGRLWYENGKFLKKKNTFYDFIACAEHLIKNQYSETKTLAITGGSAGGMLIGAVLNMRPDLFNSALAIVPFVDVINTMLDSLLPLTQMEYQEWGNPETSKEYYDYIKSYSPYDNVEKKSYPNIYIKAGLNDPRVTYWEPAKWCAKMRELKTDSHLLLLETDMQSGHAGASGRFEYLKEVARQYTFVITTCGGAGPS